MEPVTFITGNQGKVAEVMRYLGLPLQHVALDLPEIQSLESEEIVGHKARAAYESVGTPVLVEDVSFVFHALGRLPGPLIKWFEAELGNDGLCRLLEGKSKDATATVTYGFHDGTTVHFVSGSMKGTIAESPRGSNSFGWAPVFIPDGEARTYAELSSEEQEVFAMRKKALGELSTLLRNLGYAP